MRFCLYILFGLCGGLVDKVFKSFRVLGLMLSCMVVLGGRLCVWGYCDRGV